MDNYENKERSLYCHWDTHEHDVLFMNEYDLDQHLYSHFMNLSDSMMNQTDYGENSVAKSLGNPATALSVNEPTKEEKAQAVECHWDSCHETFNLDDIMGHLRQNHLEESMRPHHGACMDIDRHSLSESNALANEMAHQHQHQHQSDDCIHSHCNHDHHVHSHNCGHQHDHSHDHLGHLPNKNMPIPELSNLATPQSHDSPLAPFDGAVNESTPIVSSQIMEQPYTVKHQPMRMMNHYGEMNYNPNQALSALPESSSGDSAHPRSNTSSRVSSAEPSRPPSASVSRVASRQPSRQNSAPNSPMYISPPPNSFSNNSSEIKIDTTNLPRLSTPDTMAHETHQCMWSVGDGKVCGEIFLTSTELNAHIVHQHIDTNDQITCHWDGCQREHAPFRQKQKLVRHLQTHARAGDHKCRVCKKQMSDETQLKLHLQGHTEDRPFKCDVCQRGFRTHKNLVAHMRTHTGDKPLVCTFPGCGKRFAESSNLAKHRRTHEAPKFECHICKRKFTRRDHLVRHQRSKKHFPPEEMSQFPHQVLYQTDFNNPMGQLPHQTAGGAESVGTISSRTSSPMPQPSGKNSELPPQQLINTPVFTTPQMANHSLISNSSMNTSQTNTSPLNNSPLNDTRLGSSTVGTPLAHNLQMSNSQLTAQPNYMMTSVNPMMNPMMNPMVTHSPLANQSMQIDHRYVNNGYNPLQQYAQSNQQDLSRLPYGNLGSIPTQLNALASQLNANQLNVPANQLTALANQLEANQRNANQINGSQMNSNQFSGPAISGNHLVANNMANNSQFEVNQLTTNQVSNHQLGVPMSQLNATQLTPQGSPVDQSAMKQLDGSNYPGQPFVAAS